MTRFPVAGAALAKDEVRVFLENVPDRPGVSHQVFAAIAGKNVSVLGFKYVPVRLVAL